MYRYAIGDVERGGCVVAANKKQAENKVRRAYEKMAERSYSIALELKDMQISIWSDEIAKDVVEVYP